ncbi:hypothetical protein BU17DRAFT_92339 [Hysterangium stoloniferum]|nr:hypothetical protein BU17DRAFT_92339 [Hysterangium stoloniferum]
MPLQLRERKGPPSYKTAFELPEDGEDNMAQIIAEDDAASSESAFEVADDEDEKYNLDEEDLDAERQETFTQNDDENATATQVEDNSTATKQPKGTKKNLKASVLGETRPSTIMLAPGLSRPVARQNYALPLLSHNHRHRGGPIYFSSPRTLRLVSEPNIFGPNETVWTRSCAEPVVRQRFSKTVGSNMGEGPIWELLEDRSWFKECTPEQSRPITYTGLRVDDDATIISPDLASGYIFRDTKDSTPHAMTCYFGPYKKQSKIAMEPLQSVRMDEFFPASRSHVIFAGAPVWAMDWCPIAEEDLSNRNYKQYLAVAPFPTRNHSPEIGRKCSRPSHACIQIWSLTASDPKQEDLHDPGIMRCEMVLCLDGGPAHDLKWCPLPAHDQSDKNHHSGLRKLGVLGGTFEDGSVSFYVVPDLGKRDASLETTDPLYVRITPRLRLQLEDTMCWCMDWANSDLIVVGCTNGFVAVYHVRQALENPSSQPLRPTHYMPLHQSAIRTVSWAKVPPIAPSGKWQDDCDPTIFFSGGYDGAQTITDIRDMKGNIMNRTRDVINSIVFSHYVGGPLASDNENTIKNFGLIPSTLGRGHTLLEPSGPVWSIGTSDFHAHMAVGSADGTCQTTNILKSTRKGGAVPFFIHKIYQLDYNRKTGEFRMLEHFLPHEHQDRPAAARVTSQKKKATDTSSSLPPSTGAWSPEISVTRVVWHSGSGMARAPLLASATASGLCRVDWLLGRFPHDRFPYGGVAALRGEVGGIDNEEEVEEDESVGL